MTDRKPHPTSSLVTLAVALVAAHAAGVFGLSTAVVGGVVLLLGFARVRGAPLVGALNRPKWFAALGIGYLLFFIVDLFWMGRANPVPSLGRLVVFLLAAEVLSGDSRRAHRPVLFGLLLLVSGASLTTDLWFALPLAVFAWTATLSQLGQRLRGPSGESIGGRSTARAALSLTAASLIAGFLFFLAVPRVGAGWARVGLAKDGEQALETGLTSSVKLGSLGRVKARRTVAFRVRPDRPIVEPESLYWRVRGYDQWTGSGWTRADRSREIAVQLSPGESVPIPPGNGADEPDLVVTMTAVRADFPALPVPGRGTWIRSAESARLLVSEDGTIIPAGGRPTRRMDIAASLSSPTRVLSPDSGAADGEIPPMTLDVSRMPPAVTAWAADASAGAESAADVAQGLVDDLSRRAYSLDTRRIDPSDPVGSFLAGAPAHCEYFATALALGLRARGIPARVVGGYLGVEPAPFGDDWVVRDARAHLWTEAFLPESGWVRMDATPAAGRSVPQSALPWIGSLWDRTVIAWDTWVIGLDLGDQFDAVLRARDGILSAAGRLAKGDPRFFMLVVTLGAAAAGAWFLLRRRRHVSYAVPALYSRLLRIAARRGLTPSPWETAGEFAARAGTTLGDESAVKLLTEIYEQERFGGVRPGAAEQRAAASALRDLARGVTPPVFPAAGS